MTLAHFTHRKRQRFLHGLLWEPKVKPTMPPTLTKGGKFIPYVPNKAFHRISGILKGPLLAMLATPSSARAMKHHDCLTIGGNTSFDGLVLNNTAEKLGWLRQCQDGNWIVAGKCMDNTFDVILQSWSKVSVSGWNIVCIHILMSNLEFLTFHNLVSRIIERE